MLFKIYLTRIANKWLKRKDGSTLVIKIVPNFELQEEPLENGIVEYLLFKEDFGVFDLLSIPPPGYQKRETDYLGRILFDSDHNWVYDGQALTVFEEEKLAEFICNFDHGDSGNF